MAAVKLPNRLHHNAYVSKDLEATLRPYQVEGHAWLARLAAWGAGL